MGTITTEVKRALSEDNILAVQEAGVRDAIEKVQAILPKLEAALDAHDWEALERAYIDMRKVPLDIKITRYWQVARNVINHAEGATQ